MKYSAGYNLTGNITENSATGPIAAIPFSGQILIPTSYNLQTSGDPPSAFGGWVYTFPAISLNWTAGGSNYQFSESKISVSYTPSTRGAFGLLTYDVTGTFAGYGPADISGYGNVGSETYQKYVGPGLEEANLTINFPYAFETETIGYDIGSVTAVTQFTPCFIAGTRVATASGAVAVENLRAGAPVCSIFGRIAHAVWIGHRSVDCRMHPSPEKVWPVRVQAHALGAGLPLDDLWLSPDHALYVGGVLIPVRYLINGATVAQCPVGSVIYWHVELPDHDIILAEGLPVESYLDTGNRDVLAASNRRIKRHTSRSTGSDGS